MILMDIDDFKLVNDRHGHQEGDRILVELAKTLTEQVRDSDICCRFGGEEFVVSLPFTSSPSEAYAIAERIREKATTIICGGERITTNPTGALSYSARHPWMRAVFRKIQIPAAIFQKSPTMRKGMTSTRAVGVLPNLQK